MHKKQTQTMDDVLYKFFRDEKSVYYNPADLINKEHYVRYSFCDKSIVIFLGCNDGEIPIKVFTKSQVSQLTKFLNLILYGVYNEK